MCYCSGVHLGSVRVGLVGEYVGCADVCVGGFEGAIVCGGKVVMLMRGAAQTEELGLRQWSVGCGVAVGKDGALETKMVFWKGNPAQI